jgi:hypothetical protein
MTSAFINPGIINSKSWILVFCNETLQTTLENLKGNNSHSISGPDKCFSGEIQREWGEWGVGTYPLISC